MKTRFPCVLFIAPVEPWCRENGSSVVISNTLEGLAEHGGAELFTVFLRDPPPEYARPQAPAIDGITLGVRGLPRWYSSAGALLSGKSPLRMRFANRFVARAVIQAVRSRGFFPSLVHVEHLPVVDVGLILAKAFTCPLAYRAHNIESQLWARRLGSGGAWKQWLVRRMAKLEADAMIACQLTLAISDVDLAWVRSHAPAARVELLPCAILLSRYAKLKADATTPDPQICFVGGLEWPPNETGLRWFVQEVLPVVTSRAPDTTLAVLARGAMSRTWITQNSAVRVVSPTADAPTLFAQSRLSVAPLLQGGGVRLKILESLAIGCPVVATRIGAEGLHLPGLTSVDDPRTFADACVRHLESPPTAETRAILSDAVAKSHGANLIAGRLVGAWSQLLSTVVAEP